MFADVIPPLQGGPLYRSSHNGASECHGSLCHDRAVQCLWGPTALSKRLGTLSLSLSRALSKRAAAKKVRCQRLRLSIVAFGWRGRMSWDTPCSCQTGWEPWFVQACVRVLTLLKVCHCDLLLKVQAVRINSTLLLCQSGMYLHGLGWECGAIKTGPVWTWRALESKSRSILKLYIYIFNIYIYMCIYIYIK